MKELDELKKATQKLLKALSSAPGQGGDLTVPMMGSTSVIKFPRGIDANTAKTRYFLPPKVKKKKMGKSRPTKERLLFKDLPINIEILKGETKAGVDPDGKPWAVQYEYPYGEVAGTHALSDGDPVDVYIGPNARANDVYIVHQLTKDGNFDEDKCFIGFSSPGSAAKAYFDHGPEWGFGSMDQMSFDEFKNGYLAANRAMMKKSKAMEPPPEVKKKGDKVVPENVIEADIAENDSHYDKEWSDKFKKEFNISKFDSGGLDDKQIQKLFDGIKEASIPAKLWKDYPAKKELHIEKPTKTMPTIKGYFQEHRGETKDGRVYVFHRAFDYMDKPYRVPGVNGLSEIVIHEIGHWLAAWPLKKQVEDYNKISGWELVKKERSTGQIPDGYVISKQNPKWMRRKDAAFADNYAEKAPNEDIAETFAWYVFRPDKLKKMCPEKFKFFMKHVGAIKNKYWGKYAARART